MHKYRFISIITVSLIACFGLVQWLSAQTWSDPTSPPPNSTIPNISALAGDNLGVLGQPNSHRARFDLNMNGYPIERIGTGGGVNPAISVSATGAGSVGLHITSNTTGLYAESSTASTVGAFNRGTVNNGYGLITLSDNGGTVSAQLYGTTVLQEINAGTKGRLQIGAIAANSLSTTATLVNGSPLYYGSALLCDPNQVNCGFASSGSYGPDNLGNNDPHVATKALDLNGNRIINVVSTDQVIEARQTGLSSAVIVTNDGGGSPQGLATALYGTTLAIDSTSAGLYGSSVGGPGILATSNSGVAVEIHGKLNILDNGIGDQYISFGPDTVSDRLQAASTATGFSPADNQLYWGDMALCDPTSSTCGWQIPGGSPVPDQWELLNQTLYYETTNPNVNNPARTNVGFAVASPDSNLNYQLQVSGLARATGGYLGSLLVNNLTVNNELEVATDVWVGGNVTLTGVAGFQVDGKIYVSANGIDIAGTTLTRVKLQQLIDACQADGECN